MYIHRSFPLRGVVIAVAVAALGLVGCGSDDSDEPEGPTTTDVGADTADTGAADQPEPGPREDAVDLTGETEVTVVVGDNKYTERTILVSPGTAVIWVNEGLNRHNVIASIPDSFEDVETEELDDGGSATRTFDGAGEFAYYCSIHGTVDAGQRGWVYVADEAA